MASKAEQQRLRDTAKANAKAMESSARAEAAKTEGIKAAAEVERVRIDGIKAQAQAAKEAHRRETEGVDQARQFGFNVGGAGLGVWAGHKIAQSIETRNAVTLQNRATAASDIGKSAEKVLKRGVANTKVNQGQLRKLQGAVNAADRLRVGHVGGPRGLVPAAALLAEAVFSRFVVLPQIESETGREAVNATATAGVFAATTLWGERGVQRATPQVIPAGKDLAAIETARAVVQSPTNVTADGSSKISRGAKAQRVARAVAPVAGSSAGGAVLKGLGRASAFLLPIIAGGVALSTFSKTGSASEAAKAGTDVVTAGAISNFAEARASGSSRAASVAKAAVRSAVSMATLGVSDLAIRHYQRTSNNPRRTLSAAEKRAYHSAVTRQQLERSAAKPATSDGWTDAYVRQQAGRTIKVGGYRTVLR